MFTRKRWIPPAGLTGDAARLAQSLGDYLLSLEAPGALVNGGNVYTPTITNILNVTSSTVLDDWKYLHTDEIVFVQGLLSVRPAAAGTVTLGISLPIGSNFGTTNDGSGVVVYLTGPLIAAAVSSAANDRMEFSFAAAGDPGAEVLVPVWFSYRIIL